jgi:hypothetical protein
MFGGRAFSEQWCAHANINASRISNLQGGAGLLILQPPLCFVRVVRWRHGGKNLALVAQPEMPRVTTVV